MNQVHAHVFAGRPAQPLDGNVEPIGQRFSDRLDVLGFEIDRDVGVLRRSWFT